MRRCVSLPRSPTIRFRLSPPPLSPSPSGIADPASTVRTALVDVKKTPDSLRDVVPPGGVDMLLVVRFIQRATLLGDSSILRDLVRPGGVVLYSHFSAGVENHPIGHPSHPDDYLQRGELRAVFRGWEILLEDEKAALPDGRPMVNFLARKPAGGGGGGDYM